MIYSFLLLIIILMSPCTVHAASCLPVTGQSSCYNDKGEQISCKGSGQDGELMIGVAAPAQRFYDNKDGTITDNLTGLMWVKNHSIGAGGATWHNAMEYISKMNGNGGAYGYNDWRMPNIIELQSLLYHEAKDNASWLNSQGFSGMQKNFYWSSTTYAADSNRAWIAYMSGGVIGALNKYINADFVAVRSASHKGKAVIPKTGQSVQYHKEDDGFYKNGTSWNIDRFLKNDNCITDKLTGLMWASNANLPGKPLTWQEAIEYVKSLKLCGFNDWRMPNFNELRSLYHYGKSDPAAWLNEQGFSAIQPSYYWTSTTIASDTATSKAVHFSHGGLRFGFKGAAAYILPVRTGDKHCTSQD